MPRRPVCVRGRCRSPATSLSMLASRVVRAVQCIASAQPPSRSRLVSHALAPPAKYYYATEAQAEGQAHPPPACHMATGTTTPHCRHWLDWWPPVCRGVDV